MSHLLHSTFAPKTSPTLRRPQTRVAHNPTRSLQIQANIREIFMAALSSTMTEGKIISWIKSEGEKLSKGEGVVVVDSDKADMDVESFYDGYLSAIMVEEGNAVPVGSPAPTPSPTPTPAVESSISTVENVVPKTSVANNVIGSSIHPASEGGKRVVASPNAKKLAKELGVDLMGLMGCMPNGRIVVKDVEAAALKATTTGGGSEAAKPSSGGAGVELGSVVPFTTMQSAVSRSMLESLTVSTFRVGYTITTDALDALYKKWTQTFERELGISSSSTSEKLEAFSRKLSVDEDETRAKTQFFFILPFSCCSWLIPIQRVQAIEDVRTNVVYEVGELFELGIQLSYLLLLLALLGVGTFFVIRQVLMRRELDLSAKELQEQVRSGDASATELFELGAVMLRRKYYPAATKYLLQAIDKWDGDDQDLAQVYNALGVSYILGGKVDKGIAQFENAVKLQPGYVTAWNNLGDAYEKNNDMKSALKAFEEVLLFDPNNKIARPRRDALKEKVKMYKGVPVRSKKK